MDSKKEQALVGVFVLIVAALLIVVVFLKSGTLDKANTPYHTFFKNAGGLEPGAEVRYLNGPPIGRVSKVEFDPQDPSRMKIDFLAKPDIPVKTDSVVAITSTSPLGETRLAEQPSASRTEDNRTWSSHSLVGENPYFALSLSLGKLLKVHMPSSA